MKELKEYEEAIAAPLEQGVWRIKCECGWTQSATTPKLRSEWIRSHARYHYNKDAEREGKYYDGIYAPSSDGWSGD